jgi:FtsH-binding integral membrane protein|tara:strand:+ start:1820 stop:2602 length:783 start_codon:yes stop_codon:yes gene_type:complete
MHMLCLLNGVIIMKIGHFSSNPQTQAKAAALNSEDLGLRAYMQKIYSYMTVGLAITGLVAWLVSGAAVDQNGNTTALGNALFNSPLGFIFMLAPLGLVMMLSFRIQKMKASTAQTMFWVLSGCYGISLASIFLAYTGESVARVFFISSSTFLAASIYGYTTKRSLANFGSFLMMGLIGIIIAMVVNIFMQSTMMQFIISVVGVLIFTGLTAYDTQTLKEMYVEGENGETQVKKAIMGALKLYLDFLNLFIMLLMLLGNRR